MAGESKDAPEVRKESSRSGVENDQQLNRAPERYGGIAQLGERLLCKQEVNGSIPFISTSGRSPRLRRAGAKRQQTRKGPQSKSQRTAIVAAVTPDSLDAGKYGLIAQPVRAHA
jgi:hypothetical protein